MHQPNYQQGYKQDYQNPYERPPAQRIILDECNSDLNFVISPDGVTGASVHENGFEYMWAGARATHGVRSGKVCFEVHVLDKLHVNMPETETTPHVMRIGWSVNEASLQVGEDNLSYGYGGTGKVSVNNKFFNYGQPYSTNDIITCHIDLDSHPKAILYSKNGQYMGVAFRLGPETDGKVFYPHVTMKNMRCVVNFGSQNPLYSVAGGFSMMEWLPEQALVRAPLGPRSRQECEIIMMVGIPGAGKTYWAEKYVKDHPEKKYYILGTNTVMEKMKVMGLARKRNYHGRWDALIKQATDVLNKEFKIAERRPRNYILDQTNVYPNARRRKMNNFNGYRRIAAVVVCSNEVLKQRTDKREREEGKMVPEEAVMEMKANFTLPEVGQIFDDVWFVDEDKANSERLVEEFRQEGKAFKEAAGAAKRPSDSSQGRTYVKLPRYDQRPPPQEGRNNPYQGQQGGYNRGPAQAQYGPPQGNSHGPLPQGAYGASSAPNNYGPPRGPHYAQNGPSESKGTPNRDFYHDSRVPDTGNYNAPSSYGSYQSPQSNNASGAHSNQPHLTSNSQSHTSYDSSGYDNQGIYGQGRAYNDRYRSQGDSYGRPSGDPYDSRDSYGGQSQGYGGQSQGYGGQSQGYSSQSQGYGGQSQGYGGQSQGYGGQSQGYGGQSQGYGGQNQGYGGQSQGYGGQNQGYGGQSQGYGGQSQGYGGQSQGYGGQNQGYGGQIQGYGGQSQGYSGGDYSQSYGNSQPYYGQDRSNAGYGGGSNQGGGAYGGYQNGPPPRY